MRVSIPALLTSVAAVAQAAAFDASANTNVAIYWGQGPGQAPLANVCANPDIDIVILAFVDQFPDQSPGDYPGTNFGDACGGSYYANNGVTTDLLSSCPQIGPDITTCQAAGKKVLLSIGGGYPNSYWIQNTTTAQYFADFLWGAFGPVTSAWTANTGPRPFGAAVVDGFDFDIESNFWGAYPTAPDGSQVTDYMSRGYADMIDRLRANYQTDSSKQYYISGAPQCITPDSHLAPAIANSWFDFIFVQFYNTPQCSARAAINKMQGTGTDDISFKAWAGTPYNGWPAVTPMNPNAKIYIGLPASDTAASAGGEYYLTVTEAHDLVSQYISTPNFGGIMLWEATYSQQNNQLCNKEYASWMKTVLTTCNIQGVLDTSCGSTTSSTSTTLSTSSTSTSSTSSTSTSSSTSSTASAKPTSTDGSCGGANGFTCQGTTFGNCCSSSGYCGSSDAYCGIGCQPGFGSCAGSSSSTTSSATGKPTPVSTDGSCGGAGGFTCQGSAFGNCCSSSGWCGSSSAYCGAGCQGAFGSCTGSSATTMKTTQSSATSPTGNPTPVSPDGTCGGAGGFTCQGSPFGSCCSSSGWCGSTSAYCGTGCQSGFGTCSGSPPAQPVSTDGSCGGANGATCQGSPFGNCCSSSGWCGSTSAYCGAGCQNGFGSCTQGAKRYAHPRHRHVMH